MTDPKPRLDVEGMVCNMHFRVGEAWGLLGGTRQGTSGERVAQAYALRGKLWELIPFLKALGQLAHEHPERTSELWAEALVAPMPFGGEPIGLPKDEAAS